MKKRYIALLVFALFPFLNGCQGSRGLSKFGKYQEFVNDSPVPVIVMGMEEFNEKYLIKAKSEYANNYEYLQGLTVFTGKVFGFPKKFIFINDSECPDFMIASFFHEKKHYMCHESNCFCVIAGPMGELHATEYELITLAQNNLDDALERAVLSLHAYVTRADGISEYRDVCAMIMEDGIWEGVLHHLEKKGKDVSGLEKAE